ncbi:hypothetical protein ACILE9_01165 [Capnocytophaga cynodegmi]|uniref:hypothetical protein n=1 Tax=Capnocytophaga cynodegmi TaxID=28189 RepID=UPI0037D83F20
MSNLTPEYQLPEQYQGETKIAIKCSTEKQKRLWAEALLQMTSLKTLYFEFGIKEELFKTVCQMYWLDTLFLQTRLTSLEGIEKITNLRELALYSSPKLENIDPIGKMVGLKILGIELPKITDYSALATLVNLEELSLDGGMDRYQKLDNIHFVKNMKKLKKLSLTSTRMADKNFDAMTELTALETLDISWNYPVEEFEKLRILPNLKQCGALGIHKIHH